MSENIDRLKTQIQNDLEAWWAVRDAIIGSPHGNVYDEERTIASRRIESLQKDLDAVALAQRLFDVQEERIRTNAAKGAPDETL